MKSNQIQKIATAQKNQKKENARDIISKSIKWLCVKKSRTIEKVYGEKFGLIIGYIKPGPLRLSLFYTSYQAWMLYPG